MSLRFDGLAIKDGQGNTLLRETTEGSGTLAAPVSLVKRVGVPMVAAAGGGGVMGWTNPEGVAIIVQRVDVDVTTVATGACTLDIGYTATSAATSSDTLLDGLDVNAATGFFSSADGTDNGTNGVAKGVRVPAGKFITATVASGTVTGLVGYINITYILAGAAAS